MDLMSDVRKAQNGAGVDLKKSRADAMRNLSDLDRGPRNIDKPQRRPRIRSVGPSTASMGNAIMATTIEEEQVRAEAQPRKKLGLYRRLVRVYRKWRYAAQETHTHRITRSAEFKQFDHVPQKIDELYDDDLKGNKLKRVAFEMTTLSAGTTGKLQTVLFGGILVIELDSQRFIIAGWDDVEQL